MKKRDIFIALWVLWALTVVLGAALSLWLVGEPPLWPHFSAESTFEGITVWAAFAAWIYVMPIALVASRNWWLDQKEGQNAPNP